MKTHNQLIWISREYCVLPSSHTFYFVNGNEILIAFKPVFVNCMYAVCTLDYDSNDPNTCLKQMFFNRSNEHNSELTQH